MIVRQAVADDMGALAEIFFRAVQIGAAPAYTKEQRDAWAGTQPSAAHWAARLEGLMTLVGEDAGQIKGFISLRKPDGYLDLAFVDPDARRRGVAGEIYGELERYARMIGLQQLHTEASHMAKAFFEKHGWITRRPNVVTRHGIAIDNWIMSKHLTPSR